MNTSLLRNLVVAVAVLALVLRRQLATRPVNEGRLYTLPVIVIVLGLAQGHLIDGAHRSESELLLAADVASALVLGFYRATTVRIWRDDQGALWRRGTALTLVAWAVSIAVRIGLGALAAQDHVSTGNSVLLFLGLTLLVQNAVVDWRARTAPELRRATFNT